jgi:SAM-dependent methyltransferase
LANYSGEIILNQYHAFEKEIAFLNQHYSRLLEEHGDTPQAVQWGDKQTQERRMEILSQVGDLSSAKVLDFGCGTGHMLTFLRHHLRFTGEYVGYDLSAKMIATAQNKFPEIRFEKRDILAEGISEEFDYILINGVFNNRIIDNWRIMTALLQIIFARTRLGLAFNALSSYVDYSAPELFYVSPERVFRYCKEELSPCVTLKHDYMIKPGIVPFEFTVYAYKTEVKPRKNLESGGID